jgi:hypothetical protein
MAQLIFQVGVTMDAVIVNLTAVDPTLSTNAVTIGDSFKYTLTVDLVCVTWRCDELPNDAKLNDTQQNGHVHYSVILLNVILLNVIVMTVILLNIMPMNIIVLNSMLMNVILLNVTLLNIMLLNVIFLNAILLNVTYTNAILLDVTIMNAILLNAILISVVAPFLISFSACPIFKVT